MKKMYYGIPIFILGIIMLGFISIQPVSSFTMDVNPSIEIKTNRLDRVVEIKPLNEDAKDLLEDFNPKDKKLENTVNDLVDLMVLTGHIKGGGDNFLMLTVEDDSMDGKSVKKVNEAIAAILENKKIEATVFNQEIEKGEKNENQTGVEFAAQRLGKLDENLTSNEIANMTVRELVEYSDDNNISMESLFKVFEVIGGNAENIKNSNKVTAKEKPKKVEENKVAVEDVKKPIKKKTSLEEAKKIGLNKVGGGKIVEIEADDEEYKLKIIYEDKEYEVEIDALSGKIKDFDIDDIEDDYKEKNKRISFSQAEKIALNLVGGGKITDFELDDDEYEIEIKFNDKEHEIEIDAYSGQVIEYEID